MNRSSRNAQGRTMFFRVLARAAILRKRTALSALMATAVAGVAASPNRAATAHEAAIASGAVFQTRYSLQRAPK